jgi:hypothetical protein
MKVYDCFPFRNEFDLLDLRLELLNDKVDYFVLVEANTTFTSISKPFYFEENKEKYAKYLHKIIHVKVEDMPHDSNPWVNDIFQRNAIYRGVEQADPDDIIVVEDADEMLRPEVYDEMRNSNKDFYGFRTAYFNFKLNYMLYNHHEAYCVWSVACKKQYLKQPDAFRAQRFQLNTLAYRYDSERLKMIEHAGWHFTYLGDTEWIKTKLKSFAHSELSGEDTLAKINVEESIKKGVGFNPHDPRSFQPVKIDDYFPEVIIKNQERFKRHIIEGATVSAKELLKAK